jgi:hypothetical protein
MKYLKQFEANNKKYIITATITSDEPDELMVCIEPGSEYSYKFILVTDMNGHNLKTFTFKDANEFIRFLKDKYKQYKNYKFNVILLSDFEILQNANKYNL